MKNSTILISGAILAAAQGAVAADRIVSIQDLDSLGFQPETIVGLFDSKVGITLNPNEFLKVEADEEGKNFRFETLDHHSVIVSINYASGGFNKKSMPTADFRKND